MNDNQIILRRERPADYRAVEVLTREAFWNVNRPGCDEHYLAHILRESDAFLPALDYVAVVDGTIVGNIMYATSSVVLDAGGTLPVITFGPVSVLPEFQRQGVGKRMIRHTRMLARRMGYSAILIYGDPAYYGRLGFEPAEQFRIGGEDNRYRDALQVFELMPGALDLAAGRFLEDSIYHIDAAAAEAFDSSFPQKEKLSGTPSQLRFRKIVARNHPRS